jgi:phosphomannomutase
VEGLKFGTSGLRGLVTELIGQPAFAYSFAFLTYLADNALIEAGRPVLIGRDLRTSSVDIAGSVASAVAARKMQPVDCGALPTPALAQAAIRRAVPAIMVTGSHIPDDRNGLKFYRPDGEIDKADEAGILKACSNVPSRPANLAMATADSQPTIDYVDRLSRFFAGKLAGLRVAVYQHSSVSRDILVEVLQRCGATALPVGRTVNFMPIDTEALRPEDEQFARSLATSGTFHAIVSTDGDGDRPLIADELGEFIRGDIVGLLTSGFLGAEIVVTPVTSNSIIERFVRGRTIRTRVGSPFVLAAMADAGSRGGRSIVGFEANGGVLLGTEVIAGGRRLGALPTRDALLPILAVLALAKHRGKPLSSIVSEVGARHALAHRLQDVPGDESRVLLEKLAEDAGFRARFFETVGHAGEVSVVDGVRVELEGDCLVHYRASGNAPELRCYVEAPTQERARELLVAGLSAAAMALNKIV